MKTAFTKKCKSIVTLFAVLNGWPLLFGQSLEPRSYQGEHIKHTYYSLSYVESYEQPEWTFHMICLHCFGNSERKNNFREDPTIKSSSSQLSDYKNSGFDRGHLVPAGDMTRNDLAMSESFYMSNMSPQAASFNRGIWKKLEDILRDWSYQYDTIYIVTGPIIEPGFKTIGANKVAVPQHYFKAIYIPRSAKMVGFILPNEGSASPLSSFQVTIDEIERRTKLDLFYGLEDELETTLESTLSLMP